MKEVSVSLGRKSYKIHIDNNILSKAGKYLGTFNVDKKVLIISDKNVYEIYGEILKNSLHLSGFKVSIHIVEPGEASKSLSTIEPVYTSALSARLTRKSTIIALGGGVIGDLAGFTASTYMRGINLVQIPTSLLAQVDSSVGGKVAVNHPAAKNIIGCFYQPAFVLIDMDTLTSLPPRELYTGLAEVIKYGIIRDEEFFHWLYKNINAITGLDNKLLSHIIEKCCTIKAHIVSADEREHGIRAILNFGHTAAHGIENATCYKVYTHGEAVALGMLIETQIALERGYIESNYAERIGTLIKNAQLPVKHGDINVDKAVEAMKHDKKNTEDSIAFILPVGEGKVNVFYDISEEEIKNAIQHFI